MNNVLLLDTTHTHVCTVCVCVYVSFNITVTSQLPHRFYPHWIYQQQYFFPRYDLFLFLACKITDAISRPIHSRLWDME